MSAKALQGVGVERILGRLSLELVALGCPGLSPAACPRIRAGPGARAAACPATGSPCPGVVEVGLPQVQASMLNLYTRQRRAPIQRRARSVRLFQLLPGRGEEEIEVAAYRMGKAVDRVCAALLPGSNEGMGRSEEAGEHVAVLRRASIRECAGCSGAQGDPRAGMLPCRNRGHAGQAR